MLAYTTYETTQSMFPGKYKQVRLRISYQELINFTACRLKSTSVQLFKVYIRPPFQSLQYMGPPRRHESSIHYLGCNKRGRHRIMWTIKGIITKRVSTICPIYQTRLSNWASFLHICPIFSACSYYHVAGKFDGELHLTVWQSGLKQPN